MKFRPRTIDACVAARAFGNTCCCALSPLDVVAIDKYRGTKCDVHVDRCSRYLYERVAFPPSAAVAVEEVTFEKRPRGIPVRSKNECCGRAQVWRDAYLGIALVSQKTLVVAKRTTDEQQHLWHFNEHIPTTCSSFSPVVMFSAHSPQLQLLQLQGRRTSPPFPPSPPSEM